MAHQDEEELLLEEQGELVDEDQLAQGAGAINQDIMFLVASMQTQHAKAIKDILGSMPGAAQQQAAATAVAAPAQRSAPRNNVPMPRLEGNSSDSWRTFKEQFAHWWSLQLPTAIRLRADTPGPGFKWDTSLRTATTTNSPLGDLHDRLLLGYLVVACPGAAQVIRTNNDEATGLMPSGAMAWIQLCKAFEANGMEVLRETLDRARTIPSPFTGNESASEARIKAYAVTLEIKEVMSRLAREPRETLLRAMHYDLAARTLPQSVTAVASVIDKLSAEDGEINTDLAALDKLPNQIWRHISANRPWHAPAGQPAPSQVAMVAAVGGAAAGDASAPHWATTTGNNLGIGRCAANDLFAAFVASTFKPEATKNRRWDDRCFRCSQQGHSVASCLASVDGTRWVLNVPQRARSLIGSWEVERLNRAKRGSKKQQNESSVYCFVALALGSLVYDSACNTIIVNDHALLSDRSPVQTPVGTAAAAPPLMATERGTFDHTVPDTAGRPVRIRVENALYCAQAPATLVGSGPLEALGHFLISLGDGPVELTIPGREERVRLIEHQGLLLLPEQSNPEPRGHEAVSYAAPAGHVRRGVGPGRSLVYDTAATAVVTNDPELLVEASPMTARVTTVGEDKLVATEQGVFIARVRDRAGGVVEIRIPGALFCPGAPFTLLGRKPLGENGYRLLGDGRGGLALTNPTGGPPIDLAKRGDGLTEVPWARDLPAPGTAPPTDHVGAVMAAAALPWGVAHRRWAHLHDSKVKHAAACVDNAPKAKSRELTGVPCASCMRGLSRRAVVPRGPTRRASKAGIRFHHDCTGKKDPCIANRTAVLVSVDDYTRYPRVALLPDLSEASLLAGLQDLRADAHHAAAERGDTATLVPEHYVDAAFNTSGIKAWLRESGFGTLRTAEPHSHESNGTAERFIGSLWRSSMAVLHATRLGFRFWSAALQYTVYVKQRTASAGRTRSPHELETGRRPDLKLLRAFGCLCWVHDSYPGNPVRKSDGSPLAFPAVYLGPVRRGAHGLCLVFSLVTHTLLHRRSVRCDEGVYPSPKEPLPALLSALAARDLGRAHPHPAILGSSPANVPAPPRHFPSASPPPDTGASAVSSPAFASGPAPGRAQGIGRPEQAREGARLSVATALPRSPPDWSFGLPTPEDKEGHHPCSPAHARSRSGEQDGYAAVPLTPSTTEKEGWPHSPPAATPGSSKEKEGRPRRAPVAPHLTGEKEGRRLEPSTPRSAPRAPHNEEAFTPDWRLPSPTDDPTPTSSLGETPRAPSSSRAGHAATQAGMDPSPSLPRTASPLPLSSPTDSCAELNSSFSTVSQQKGEESPTEESAPPPAAPVPGSEYWGNAHTVDLSGAPALGGPTQAAALQPTYREGFGYNFSDVSQAHAMPTPGGPQRRSARVAAKQGGPKDTVALLSVLAPIWEPAAGAAPLAALAPFPEHLGEADDFVGHSRPPHLALSAFARDPALTTGALPNDAAGDAGLADHSALRPVRPRGHLDAALLLAPKSGKVDKVMDPMLGGEQIRTPSTPRELNKLDPRARAAWAAAKQAEIEGLLLRGTFAPDVWNADEARKHGSVLHTTWVLKRKSSGQLKGRLTAAGNGETGFTPGANSSPTLGYPAFRLLCILGVAKRWRFSCVDVSQAYITSRLPPARTPVFLYSPPELGFGRGAALKLEKSLYGLADAGLVFFRLLQKTLLAFGLHQSDFDPCIFYSDSLLIGVYVDDLSCFAASDRAVLALRTHLRSHGMETTSSTTGEVLGMQVTQAADNASLTVDMRRYEHEMLCELGFEKVKPRRTPAPPIDELPVLPPGQGQDRHIYRVAVGKLLHLTKIRSILMEPVRRLTQHLLRNNDVHWQAVARVCAYVQHTLGEPWVVSDVGPLAELRLLGCSDASWAASASTRHSVLGTCLFLGGHMFEARSRTLRALAISSTAAEIYAASECAHSILYYRRLLRELGCRLDAPTRMEVDSQPAIANMRRFTVSSKSKHISIRTLRVRQLVSDRVVDLVWVPSADQCADVLTKGVTGDTLERFAKIFSTGRRADLTLRASEKQCA